MTSHTSQFWFTRDSKHIVSSESRNTVRIWDLASGQSTDSLPFRDLERTLRVTFSPTKNILAACSYERFPIGRVTFWRINQNGKVAKLYENKELSSPYISRDGRFLIKSLSRRVEMWQIRHATEKKPATEKDGPFSTPKMPNVTPKYRAHLSLKERWANRNLRSFRNILFSPDSTMFATGGERGRIAVWDAQTGKLVTTIKTTNEQIDSVAFHPKKRWLVGESTTDKTIRMWDIETGRERWTSTAYSGLLRGVAISPDGKTVVTAGRDRLHKYSIIKA